MDRPKISYESRKYKWGYSLWIVIGYKRILLADKLKTTNEVLDYIANDVSDGKLELLMEV